tara:strand:+ start:210 stop:389 length:180 start_codon:yes stop_codon:yes gene_type:complete
MTRKFRLLGLHQVAFFFGKILFFLLHLGNRQGDRQGNLQGNLVQSFSYLLMFDNSVLMM